MNPQVSIIFPVKDTAKYLPACLDSILAQTYTNWELIAVDDFSSDQSLQILKSYAEKDSRIRVVKADKPKLIAVLNQAFSLSKGDVITRMDSDDIMPENKLELMVNAAEKGCVVTGKVHYFTDEGELGEGFKKYADWLNNLVDNNNHWQEIFQECVIPSQCWMMYRDDFKRIGAFHSESYPEDYDLCFRMFKHKLNVKPINTILNFWRDRSDRISRTFEEYKDNRFLKLKMTYFSALNQNKNVPLAVWGAGRNGKDVAKLLLENQQEFTWLCDNKNKVGKDIYGVVLVDSVQAQAIEIAQIIVAVASPEEKAKIKIQLNILGKKLGKDYWFWV